MRVPIENGLGLINQVLDFIKLSATYRDSVYVSYKKNCYLKSIFPVARDSSSQKTWYT